MSTLPASATVTWADKNNGLRMSQRASTIHILESGWLRVHWLDGKISYLSPSAVHEVQGEGVIYSDA